MTPVIRVLFLGDVIGQPGCRALFINLKSITKKIKADMVIVNGENANEGFGLTSEIMTAFFKSGVDVITSGNHIWQQKEIYPYLESEDKLLRPENYDESLPGKGSCTIIKKEIKIAVVNLQGRMFLSPLRCPLKIGRETARRLSRETKVIIVDFHAESVEEKEALALYLDGQVSAVIGTHTHVQTADQRILPAGTGYLTDVGMVGPLESVIGMNRETAIQRGLTQMPLKMDVVEKPAMMMGVLLEIDVQSGKTVAIELFSENSSV
ncbi:MAG: TIGR00282 family metallophosphoesterase [Spirochaeta sp.]|nr:TIGR00282 family metallophosphoesterase [Spirochaeta sp.]